MMTKKEYELNPRLHWEERMTGRDYVLITEASNPLWVKHIQPDILINTGKDLCVDMGCGGGRYLKMTAEHFKNVIGVDFSSSSIEEAKQNTVGIENITLYHASLIDMKNIVDNSVDFAYSIAVLMHMTKDARKAALKEIHRILKPDGRAVLLEITSMEIGAFDCPNLTPLEWEIMLIEADLVLDEKAGRELEASFVRYKVHKRRVGE